MSTKMTPEQVLAAWEKHSRRGKPAGKRPMKLDRVVQTEVKTWSAPALEAGAKEAAQPLREMKMSTKMTPEQVLAAWEASGGSKLEAGAKRRRKRRCREDVAPALEAGAKRRRRRCRRAREDAPALEAGAKKRAKKKVKTFPALVKRCAKKAKTAKGKARCAKKVRGLAAWLGRKKYGKKAMAKKAAAGLRKAARAGKKRRAREDAPVLEAGAKKRCG